MNISNASTNEHSLPQIDYMCEYQNRQVEENFEIKKDIYIENDPTLKKESDPNPNEPFRLARKIFQNYIFLLRNVKAMLQFLRNYKYVLCNFADKKRLTEKKTQEGLTLEEEQRLTELQQTHLPLIINKIVLIKSKQQKQAIYHAINKLKLMVMKARYKQSTTLEYLIDSYIAKLKLCLNCYVKYRQEKGENSMMIELKTSSHEFILVALQTIKNRFDVIDLKNIRYYKITNEYLSAIHKKQSNQQPIFFMNLFTETLLYIERQYTGFNQNLLFCPIISIAQSSIKISEEYMGWLNSEASEWSRHQLYIEIYHVQTSLKQPIFYSKIIQKRQSINIHPDRYFPERLKKQLSNLEQLINYLSLIRRCVFAKMIMHWLAKIFHAQKHKVELTFHGKFKAVIRNSSEPIFYQQKNHDQDNKKPEYRSEIMTNILLFIKDPKHLCQTKQSLRQQLYSLLEASIFKIIAEKSGTRASWPLQCGSLGKNYYEHLKDRPLQRGVIEKYFHNF